jgi:hypothetical protein
MPIDRNLGLKNTRRFDQHDGSDQKRKQQPDNKLTWPHGRSAHR